MDITYGLRDTAKIKSIDWYNKNKDENGNIVSKYRTFTPEMAKYCGKYITITSVHNATYHINLDNGEYVWTDEMFEDNIEPKFKIGDNVQIKSIDWYNNNRELATGLIYGTVCFNRYDVENCSKIAVITGHSKFLGTNCYTIDLTGDDEIWSDYMFEDKVVSQHNCNNTQTVCDNTQTVCGSQTKFNKNNIVLDL